MSSCSQTPGTCPPQAQITQYVSRDLGTLKSIGDDFTGEDGKEVSDTWEIVEVLRIVP